jgi:[histone H3]-dimethyl/trimethyl-L-lysine36 demethylase
VGPAWRDAYALACLHVAGLRAADDRRAALRALDMGGGLLRAELEAAISKVFADHGRDGEVAAAVDVDRWKEGLSRNRDLADVSISAAHRIATVSCLLV